MGERSIESLTEGQRACLRLVRQGMTSKQIALELGISPATADQRCAAAVKKLGARDRMHAAILLEQHECAGGIYGRTIYDPPDVSLPPELQQPLALSSEEEALAHLREERATYKACLPEKLSPSLLDRWLPGAGSSLALSLVMLVAWIAILAISAAGAVATLEAFSRIRGR